MSKPNRPLYKDISVTLKSKMVHWPGDPVMNIRKVKDMQKGDICNVSKLELGTHTGTHMDAPLHFLKNGKGLDEMPLDVTIGPARVILIKNKVAINSKELKKHNILKGERILFKTINSSHGRKTNVFKKNFVYVSKDAAQYLAERDVRMIGIDYLSVGGFYKDSLETHRALLKAGIWIVEGLNLSRVKIGLYYLICLPLKIFRSDGAPARAILYPIENFKK
jgi:arylformamidase